MTNVWYQSTRNTYNWLIQIYQKKANKQNVTKRRLSQNESNTIKRHCNFEMKNNKESDVLVTFCVIFGVMDGYSNFYLAGRKGRYQGDILFSLSIKKIIRTTKSDEIKKKFQT